MTLSKRQAHRNYVFLLQGVQFFSLSNFWLSFPLVPGLHRVPFELGPNRVPAGDRQQEPVLTLLAFS